MWLGLLPRSDYIPALCTGQLHQKNGFHHRGDHPRAQGCHQPALTKAQEEADPPWKKRATTDVPERRGRKETEDEEDEDAQRVARKAQEKSARAEHKQGTSMLQ